MKQNSLTVEFEAASGSLEAASNSKESHSIISISEKKKDKKEKHKLKLVKKSKQADKDTEVENKGKLKQQGNKYHFILSKPYGIIHYFSYRTIIPRGDVRIGDKHP